MIDRKNLIKVKREVLQACARELRSGDAIRTALACKDGGMTQGNLLLSQKILLRRTLKALESFEAEVEKGA